MQVSFHMVGWMLNFKLLWSKASFTSLSKTGYIVKRGCGISIPGHIKKKPNKKHISVLRQNLPDRGWGGKQRSLTSSGSTSKDSAHVVYEIDFIESYQMLLHSRLQILSCLFVMLFCISPLFSWLLLGWLLGP